MDYYVDLYPIDDSDDLLMISNNAECVNAAIDALKAMDGVENIEAGETVVSSQWSSDTMSDPKDDRGPFKYRVFLRSGLPSQDALTNKVVDAIRQAVPNDANISHKSHS